MRVGAEISFLEVNLISKSGPQKVAQ